MIIYVAIVLPRDSEGACNKLDIATIETQQR